MSHWGLYIIRVNHSLKGTLNEDEPRRGIAPKFPTLSADRRWTCPGDLWICTLFSIFSCFWYPKRDTRVTRQVVKIYPFYAFLFTRMMYRPQWDIPPPLPRGCNTHFPYMQTQTWDIWVILTCPGPPFHDKSQICFSTYLVITRS